MRKIHNLRMVMDCAEVFMCTNCVTVLVAFRLLVVAERLNQQHFEERLTLLQDNALPSIRTTLFGKNENRKFYD